jgi:hypothetical protein
MTKALKGRTRVGAVLPLALAAAAATACDRPSPYPTGPGASQSAASPVIGQVGPKRLRASEALQWELVRQEPSIAGVHIDSLGNTVVDVTDVALASRAITIVDEALRSSRFRSRARTRGRIITRKAEYSFQQLSNWRELVADSLLGRLGVVMDDLDEAKNRVTIGVARNQPADLAELRKRLINIGVPLQAVNFVVTSMPRPASARPAPLPFTPSTLNSEITPTTDSLGGGFSHGTTYHTCSTSIVADRAGERGFITASHCSETMFNPDSNEFSQPQLFGSYPVIGFEAADPYPVTCDWWEMNVTPGCDDKRPSDAAFVKLSHSLHGRRGAIARTQGGRVSGSSGSVSINSGNPWINVSAQESSVLTGWTLDKVGLRTGWTYGTVTGTCIDAMTVEQGKHHLMYCLDNASIYLGQGDSGAPVFMYDGDDGAIYYGVVSLLGGSCSDLCTSLYYSSVGQIEQDLGTVNTRSEITVGSVSASGSIDGLGEPQLSWSAVSTTNTTATTVYRIYRAVWDASTNSWSDPGGLYTTTTGTSFTDGGLNWAVSEFTGSTEPAECVYSYVYYYVVAYNAGIKTQTAWLYFRGPADGMTPGAFQCQ